MIKTKRKSTSIIMKEQQAYRSLAKYYDLIYHWKDYKKEAKQVIDYISKFKQTEGNTLLDVACGSGSHLQYFADSFNCTGIDLNAEIIEIARKKQPEIDFIQADMSDFNLQKKFDIITCLFSSIGYITSKDKLAKTFEQFAKHMKKGGLLLIEPWLSKEIFTEGTPHMIIYDSKDLKIARLNINEIKDDISYFEMHYLIAEKNRKVQHFVDKHEMAMFPIELLIELMESNGYKTQFLKEDMFSVRGLLVGVKE